MNCVWIDVDGTVRDVQTCQTQAHILFEKAPLTMVGAVHEIWVFAVARANASDLPENPACTNPARFDLPVHGPVLFVATDANGDQMNVDREALLTLLHHTPP